MTSPTKTYYHRSPHDTVISQDNWCNENGALHRVDEPAMIIYDIKCNIREKHWFINGKRHRLDGPATLWFFDDGAIRYTRWWIDGIRISGKRQEWLEENGILPPYSLEDLMAFRLRWV